MGNDKLASALLATLIVVLVAYYAFRRDRSGFRPLPVMTCAAAARQSPPEERREGFRPLALSTCTPYGEYYGVDMTGLRASPRDAAGTVAWDPYSTQSRVSLERYAETPEVATDLGPYLGPAPPSTVRMNPVTGLGRTSSVRAMGDRYRRNEALTGLSVYDLGPGDPGYMEEVGDTHAMNLMAVVARRSPPAPSGKPACLLAASEIDADFYTDGFFGQDVIMESFNSGRREGLTSTRGPSPNTLTASRVGLGSIRMDPRFEPGPECRTPDGDASWSPGDWAGGPTTGAYGASVFAAPNAWNWVAVQGFGDGSMWGRTYPVEAVVTGESEW